MSTTDPKKFLAPDEKRQVEAAIEEAERNTSAEIKLVIARYCWGSLAHKAEATFRKLGLDQTAGRNCVMILVITTNREFLVCGDQAVHEKVGQGFWDDVRNEMIAGFRDGQYGRAIAQGVGRIGEKLAGWFPHQDDDVNEISNEASHVD